VPTWERELGGPGNQDGAIARCLLAEFAAAPVGVLSGELVEPVQQFTQGCAGS